MLRLTRHEPYDDAPESFPFPTHAARFLRRAHRPEEAPLDKGASAAARRVEQAMRNVELRFKSLRELMGFSEPDPDRPRAA